MIFVAPRQRHVESSICKKTEVGVLSTPRTAAIRTVRKQVEMFTSGVVITEHPCRVSVVVAAAHRPGPYNVWQKQLLRRSP